ncbi:endocuticle structural glycoprotein SgAbd-5-like [Danaus plexippus]|uniref:endocuticle structural glycoprotein SgAbd-5-like n=1 Tax=Danaus plexippus TaxID=13037 RepID=UPI002AB2575D|nr:endocuticle structural glycoprotein SgAbd-5-like [Danaus plexippus]
MIAMKLFVFGLVLVASLAEDGKQPPAEIITERTIVRDDGYDFEFKTSDGTSRKEEAGLITVGDRQGIAVKGSYSYLSPDGLEYIVSYTADDKGFKPQLRVASKSE